MNVFGRRYTFFKTVTGTSNSSTKYDYARMPMYTLSFSSFVFRLSSFAFCLLARLLLFRVSCRVVVSSCRRDIVSFFVTVSSGFVKRREVYLLRTYSSVLSRIYKPTLLQSNLRPGTRVPVSAQTTCLDRLRQALKVRNLSTSTQSCGQKQGLEYCCHQKVTTSFFKRGRSGTHRSGHQRPPPRAVGEEESGDRKTLGEVEVGGIRTGALEGTLCQLCFAFACVLCLL